jgi:hypothetical protein
MTLGSSSGTGFGMVSLMRQRFTRDFLVCAKLFFNLRAFIAWSGAATHWLQFYISSY